MKQNMYRLLSHFGPGFGNDRRAGRCGFVRLLPACFLFIVISCATVHVSYDYDTATDFSSYTTYNYYPEMASGLNQLDEKRLIKAVDSAMLAKGFQFSEEPDFLINMKSSAYRSPQSSSLGVGVGGGSGGVGGGVSVGVPLGQPNFEREIVFDLVDSQKDVLIWQAVSSSNFRDNAAPATREKQLREIVRKVFGKFPPKSRN